ncbi:class I SAM-dependent methyltransferase [Patescibacteria group bacterium]|nr:class I SAM-dependent methyltransferase [Patescibacteria group bacterium]
MNLYKFIEKPKIYNFIEKILSLGNKSCERCLLELINSNKHDLLLDVGCGTAKYANLLPGKYYGIDTNKDYIDYAKNNYKGNFSVMDATDLEFPDNNFNFVFNVGVLHHISDENVKMALDEMKRVCKNNGKIFIIEAIYPSKINFIGYLLFKFDRGKYTRTINNLKELLEGKNFSLLRDNIKGSFPYKLCVFVYENKLL